MKPCLFPFLPILVLTAALPGLALAADESNDEPSATPSRPTSTSGASISAPGWIEIELGIQRTRDKSDETRQKRDALPYLLKYSFNPNWALWLGGEASIRDKVDGLTTRGVGDATVTVKHKLDLASEGHSAGFEVSTKIPTANEKKGLGSGETDYGLRGIYGLDLPAGFHIDGNLAVTRSGLREEGIGRNSYFWGTAISRPVTDALTLALDLSGTRQSGVPSTRQLMFAASYSLSKRVVADAGMQWGLNKYSPEWTAFAGVTILLGKI